MNLPDDVNLEYPTPDALRRRIDLAEDPLVGELFHNMMEDYRWWGHRSKYSAFQEYFQNIRHREIHKLYHRQPLNEFLSLLEQPGDKESFSVLPIADQDANLYTAYPPGVDPPVILHDKSPDIIPIAPEAAEHYEVAEVEKHLRQFIDLSDTRTAVHEFLKDDFYNQYDTINKPYWTGEAIVPDLNSKLPEVVNPRFSIPPSPYSAFDRLAVDEIFGESRPVGDLSSLELARGPLKEKHRANTFNSHYADKPAAWGEQVALRQAYERALYTHHIASLIAAEQGVKAPNAPLPDPRLSSSSLLDARSRFASRLATLATASQILPSDASPLDRLQHQAKVAALVVVGQESGFLPSDTSKLPRIFQDALAKMDESAFIVDRAEAIDMRERGIEKSRQIRNEILANPELPRDMLVSWSGPEERYMHAPRRLESWEKVGEAAAFRPPLTSLVPPHITPSVIPSDAALPTTTNPSITLNSITSTTPATATGKIATEMASHSLEASQYFAHDHFDWKNFNRDVYHAGMTEAEFDVACEAMLHAVDLHFQQHTLGLEPNMIPEAQREHLMQSPTSLWAKRNQQLTAKMAEFDKGHPFPQLPKRLTRESYTLFEQRVKQHIAEREGYAMKLSEESPLNIPSLEFASSAPSEAQLLDNAKEAPVYWSEAIMERLEAEMSKYHEEYAEFLMKDARGQLTMEEVRAFAERNVERLGVVGMDGTKATIQKRFETEFMPLNCMSAAEIELIHGSDAVVADMVSQMDHEMRIGRAKVKMEEMGRYWDSKIKSLDELVSEQWKPTTELEKARREAVLMRKDVIHEVFLSMSQEESVKMEERLAARLARSKHIQSTLLALRDMNIIQTDVEFKYFSVEPMPRLTPHQPLHPWLVPPMRVIAAIHQYGINMPRVWAMKAMFHFSKLFYPFRLVRTLALRFMGWHHIPNPWALRLDSQTLHEYHPYYRKLMHRYLVLFDTSSTAAWDDRLRATQNYIPTWSQWRRDVFKMNWIDRLARWVRPRYFWGIPAAIFTGMFTFAYLEQRKTWAHDLLRNHPAGLEIAANERRKWIQRNQLRLPRIFSPNIGPRGIWYGLGDTPAEFQNAPYLHRAYSSNAREYNPLQN